MSMSLIADIYSYQDTPLPALLFPSMTNELLSPKPPEQTHAVEPTSEDPTHVPTLPMAK